MKRFFSYGVIAATCVLGLASSASAQGLITWGTSVNMFQQLPVETEETFVDTTGVGLVALNASLDPLADATVNGVLFDSTLVNETLIGVNGHSITINDGNDNEASFQDGEFNNNVEIFNLIRGSAWAVTSVTLDGLVVGTDYSVQVFTNDARGNRTSLFVTGLGDGSGATAPVGFSDLNNSPPGTMVDPVTGEDVLIPAVFPDSEAGDSIIGTFTAASTSLTFNLFGSNSDPADFQPANGRAQVNAIQLRDVSDVVDPGVLKGDVNLDGGVTFLDIQPFITVLSSNGFQAEADCDCNGEVTFLDIQPFINILAGL